MAGSAAISDTRVHLVLLKEMMSILTLQEINDETVQLRSERVPQSVNSHSSSFARRNRMQLGARVPVGTGAVYGSTANNQVVASISSGAREQPTKKCSRI